MTTVKKTNKTVKKANNNMTATVHELQKKAGTLPKQVTDKPVKLTKEQKEARALFLETMLAENGSRHLIAMTKHGIGDMQANAVKALLDIKVFKESDILELKDGVYLRRTKPLVAYIKANFEKEHYEPLRPRSDKEYTFAQIASQIAPRFITAYAHRKYAKKLVGDNDHVTLQGVKVNGSLCARQTKLRKVQTNECYNPEIATNSLDMLLDSINAKLASIKKAA